jgi:hypothetical protein
VIPMIHLRCHGKNVLILCARSSGAIEYFHRVWGCMEFEIPASLSTCYFHVLGWSWIQTSAGLVCLRGILEQRLIILSAYFNWLCQYPFCFYTIGYCLRITGISCLIFYSFIYWLYWLWGWICISQFPLKANVKLIALLIF